MSEACPSCGIAVAGGAEGCQRLFESIGLREYVIDGATWLEDLGVYWTITVR